MAILAIELDEEINIIFTGQIIDIRPFIIRNNYICHHIRHAKFRPQIGSFTVSDIDNPFMIYEDDSKDVEFLVMDLFNRHA